MLHDWDTVLKEIPASRARMLADEEIAEIRKQEHVYSLHPQCPEKVTYVGSRLDGHGHVDDYYKDEEGKFWYDSRSMEQPVVTEFRYGGGRLCRRRWTRKSSSGSRKRQ